MNRQKEMNLPFMELREYCSIILKRMWMILLITALTGGTVWVISTYYLERIFESSTIIYVGKQTDMQTAVTYQELLLSENIVKDYRELLKTRSITERVRKELESEVPWIGSLSNQQLASRISVDLKNDTRFIEIKVRDGDPEAAMLIANQVAEVFKEKVIEIMRVQNVSVIDRADYPSEPVKPKPFLYTAIASMAGLLAGLGLVFFIEFLDNTIKTAEDVQRYTGLVVVGTIPKYEKKEAAEDVRITYSRGAGKMDSLPVNQTKTEGRHHA